MHKQEAILSTEEQALRDSLALHIAVMPVMDCFPIYYAWQTGIIDTAQHDICLHTYLAQMDVDTAIQRGTVNLAYTDHIRTLRLAPKIDKLHVIMRGHENWSLICQKGKRVKKQNQLKEKMIATCRLSAVDYWCDAMVDSLKTNDSDIYRPQINDVQLRADMMRTNLIDAALMPWPYNQWMRQQGLRCLATSSEKDPKLACWTIHADSTLTPKRDSLLHQFTHIYNQAVAELNHNNRPDAVQHILTNIYHIPTEIVDSLTLPTFHKADFPKDEEIDVAEAWLTSKDRMPKGVDKTRLIQTKYLRK